MGIVNEMMDGNGKVSISFLRDMAENDPDAAKVWDYLVAVEDGGNDALKRATKQSLDGIDAGVITGDDAELLRVVIDRLLKEMKADWRVMTLDQIDTRNNLMRHLAEIGKQISSRYDLKAFKDDASKDREAMLETLSIIEALPDAAMAAKRLAPKIKAMRLAN